MPNLKISFIWQQIGRSHFQWVLVLRGKQIYLILLIQLWQNAHGSKEGQDSWANGFSGCRCGLRGTLTQQILSAV